MIILFKQKLYKQYQNKEIIIPTLLSSLFLWTAGLLYFFWIKYSSPSVASMLLLLQSFSAFIIFNIFWKENYNLKQVFGAIFLLIWWVLVLYEWGNYLNIWALIMVVASVIFTLWNFFTKKASLKWASPFFLLVNRNIFMIVITTFLAFTFVWKPDLELIKQNFLWIFLIWFLVLFLSKTLWIMALSKLDSFVAISSFPIIPTLVLIFFLLYFKWYSKYSAVTLIYTDCYWFCIDYI